MIHAASGESEARALVWPLFTLILRDWPERFDVAPVGIAHVLRGVADVTLMDAQGAGSMHVGEAEYLALARAG